MRFFCINDTGWYNVETKKGPNPGPVKGDIVTKSSEDAEGGLLFYSFEEWPDGGLYLSTMFIPVNESSKKEQAESVTFEKVTKEHPVSVN